MEKSTATISSGNAVSEQANHRSIIELGYKGKRVAEPYIVRIRTNDENFTNITVVRAIMQEEIQLRTSSRWEAFGQGSLLGTIGERILQFGWNTTATFAFMSRRMWRGTTPIELNLKLQFEAENDALEEVVKPTLVLQQLALPGVRKTFKPWIISKPLLKYFGDNEVTVLYPPGPSPFINSVGDQITVSVGEFLKFSSVVIKDISVKYAPKLTVDGYPISSVVNVQFETYEIVTKEGLDDIYSNVAWRRKRKTKYTKFNPYGDKDKVYTPSPHPQKQIDFYNR